MNYRDAIKLLGIKKGASDLDISRAYKKLAKKYHPDVDGGSQKKFHELVEAKIISQGGDIKNRIEYKGVYNKLKRLLPVTPTNEQIEKASKKIMKSSKDDMDINQKVSLAKEQIMEESFKLESIIRRKAGKARRNIDPKASMHSFQKKMLQHTKARIELSIFERRILNIIQGYKKRLGKPHIPLLQKHQGKTVTKYVALTATILGLIVAGKITYDNKKKVFKPLMGLLTHGGKIK